jgi:hypothetical protein
MGEDLAGKQGKEESAQKGEAETAPPVKRAMAPLKQ